MWVLIAVAARVAAARGLGPNDLSNWPPYDLEIRRRLWLSIGILDTHAALERGSVPILHSEDFQFPPLNINDSDLSLTPIPRPLLYSSTDMSFSCMAHEAMVCHKNICSPYVGPGGLFSEWNNKLRIISDFEESMKRQYSWIDESAKPFERFTRYMADATVLHMQLILRRPPYRNKNNPVPPWDDFDLMKVITSLLEKSLQRQADNVYTDWAWFTYPKWYVLAILLVELCSCRTTVEFSNRAYSIAQSSFEQYAPLASDTDSGMFWRPITKLMRRVQKLRGNAVTAGVQQHQSMGGIIAEMELELSETSKRDNNNIMDDFSTSLSWDQGIGIVTASNQITPPASTSTNIAGSESTGGEFARGSGSENSLLETDDGMAWINWDLFLTDLNNPAAALF